jgi:hypothetical protein
MTPIVVSRSLAAVVVAWPDEKNHFVFFFSHFFFFVGGVERACGAVANDSNACADVCALFVRQWRIGTARQLCLFDFSSFSSTKKKKKKNQRFFFH